MVATPSSRRVPFAKEASSRNPATLSPSDLPSSPQRLRAKRTHSSCDREHSTRAHSCSPVSMLDGVGRRQVNREHGQIGPEILAIGLHEGTTSRRQVRPQQQAEDVEVMVHVVSKRGWCGLKRKGGWPRVKTRGAVFYRQRGLGCDVQPFVFRLERFGT